MNRICRIGSVAAGLWIFGVGVALGGGKEERAYEVKASIYKHNQGAREWSQKLAAMSESPFTFYRATAHLYYEDLKNKHGRLSAPPEWSAPKLVTWLSGDFHFQNVGVEAPAAGLRFELNDFDEACEGPFYWDVLRLAASIHLLTGPQDHFESFKLKPEEADELVAAFLKRYDDALDKPLPASDTAGLSLSAIDAPADPAMKQDGHFLHDRIAETSTAVTAQDVLHALELGAHGAFDIAGQPKKLAPVPCDITITDADWEYYKKTLDPKYVAEKGAGYFTRRQQCMRLNSGLGSLGVLKIYVMIEGEHPGGDDDILLEAKEEKPAGPIEAGLSQAADPEPAARVSQGVRHLTAAHDPLEGWFHHGDLSFHVSPIVPGADGFKVKSFDKQKQFTEFLAWTATALAYAHARASQPGFAKHAHEALDGPMREQIAALAKAYADQVREDWASFSASERAPKPGP